MKTRFYCDECEGQGDTNMRDRTPVSASQQRIIRLLAITLSDAHDGYSVAKDAIETAGYVGSGIPAGHTWRTAKTLSDAALLAATKIVYSDDEVNDMCAGPQF